MGEGFFVMLLGATLSASSYFGGTANSETIRAAAFVDSSGCIVIAGHTNAADIPILNAAQPASAGGQDAFVAKLDPTGTTLLWSTYLGGSVVDTPYAIVADAAGNVYVAGETSSTNFPTTAGAFQTTYAGGGFDAFVVKYSPTGAKLWATYVGGTGEERLRGMVIDGGLAVYAVGFTASTTFPTTAGAAQTTYGGGGFDAFVTKLAPDGASLVWSTFLGGSAADRGNAIALDAAGNAFVTGQTLSANFPLVAAFDSTLGGTTDAFVTRIDAGGATLGWSSFFGGSGVDIGQGLDLSGGGVLIAGDTASADLPAAGSFGPVFHVGADDVFVARVAEAGPALSWCGYLGGTGGDGVRALAVDAAGNAVVGGFTTSADFPLVAAFDLTQDGQEGFLASVGAAGTSLLWSSYVGGSSTIVDSINGASLSADGTRVVAGGSTQSAYFPYPSIPGYDKVLGGPADGFFTVVDNASTTAVRVEGLEVSRRDGAARISWRLIDAMDVAEMRVVSLAGGSERLVAAVSPDPLEDAYAVDDPDQAGGPWALDVVDDAGSVARFGPVTLAAPDHTDGAAGCGRGDASSPLVLGLLCAVLRGRRRA